MLYMKEANKKIALGAIDKLPSYFDFNYFVFIVFFDEVHHSMVAATTWLEEAEALCVRNPVSRVYLSKRELSELPNSPN